jgi:hypothetical protein
MDRQDEIESGLVPTILRRVVWTLIYAGMFAVGIGLTLTQSDATYSAILLGGGGIAIFIGLVLIGVRSKLR